MASLNKVLLIGNLTREPELRYTPGGAAVCEFGIAMNRRYSSGGQDREEACFVDIVVWNKQAESCNRFLEKGSPVFVEGRLQFDQWQDRESGTKRSRLRVTAERVQFLGSRGEGQQTGGGYDNQQRGGYNQQPQQQQQSYQQQQQQPYAQPQQYPQHPMPQQNQRPAAPQAQPGQQAPPPMPEGAFDVGDAEDDIPF